VGKVTSNKVKVILIPHSYNQITFYLSPNFNLRLNSIQMSLIVVGTMAFDAIETPFGKIDKIIGGSATYVAYAASNFVKPINQVSIIGYDFPGEELQQLVSRGVVIDGVETIKDKKSFFWSGLYHEDMNSRDTLVTDLNVLADFDPKLPASYQDSEFLMLGNLQPIVQMNVIKQLKQRPKLIVMDTMNFWMESAMSDLEKVVREVDALLINDAEARQLSGQSCKDNLENGTKIFNCKKRRTWRFAFSW
jgi:sugar/nucleoside kinase (ribokinase family)